jgi:hypothetical protein
VTTVSEPAGGTVAEDAVRAVPRGGGVLQVLPICGSGGLSTSVLAADALLLPSARWLGTLSVPGLTIFR